MCGYFRPEQFGPVFFHGYFRDSEEVEINLVISRFKAAPSCTTNIRRVLYISPPLPAKRIDIRLKETSGRYRLQILIFHALRRVLLCNFILHCRSYTVSLSRYPPAIFHGAFRSLSLSSLRQTVAVRSLVNVRITATRARSRFLVARCQLRAQATADIGWLSLS